jgi:hypothetical protein
MDELGVSLRVAPLGVPGEGGPSTGNVQNLVKEGFGYGPSLSIGALLREPGVERPCWGP